jgi:hypothetical protein
MIFAEAFHPAVTEAVTFWLDGRLFYKNGSYTHEDCVFNIG